MTNLDRQKFISDGYLLTDRFVDINERVRRECEKLYRRSKKFRQTTFVNGSKYVVGQTDRGKIYCSRVEWVKNECPAAFDLMCSRQVVSGVRLLNQHRALNIIISQINFRENGDGVKYAWHRDLQSDKGAFNDPLALDATVVVFIALTDIDETQSPILVLPKSHRNINLDTKNVQFDEREIKSLPLQAGQLIFMHPALLHSSSRHSSLRKRFLAIAAFCPAGTYTRTRSDFSVASI